ncbi:Uncharacterized protein FWK35_00036203, partial [Aphis craccivora]
LARKVVTPDCRANLLEVNIKNYLHPRPYLGYEFEAKCSSLKMRPEVEKVIHNLSILQNTSLLSPAKCLNTTKDSIASLAKLMNFESQNISKIESQWTKINLVQWKSTTSTESLWAEICNYTDSSGINPFNELCKLAKCLLVLPWSNAEVERCFSQMNLVKNKQRNKLSSSTTNAILFIRAGLRRLEKCCNNFQFPDSVLLEIGTMKAYEKCDEKECNTTDASNSAIEMVYETDDSDLDNPDS